MEPPIQFDVLGLLRVRKNSVELTIRGVRERIILAVLLLHAGETVLVERLVDAVWEAKPPQNARNQVQGCVSRLRRQFAAVGIERQLKFTAPHGYRIETDPHSIDLLQFRRLRDEARRARADGERETAKSQYRDALRLWNGSAFVDIESALAHRAAVVLEEERVQALESVSKSIWRSVVLASW